MLNTLEILTKTLPFIHKLFCDQIIFSKQKCCQQFGFSWSRCETEFGVWDTYQESAPGKGREEKQEWAEREIRPQCRLDKALPSSRGPLEQEWPVTVALGRAEMAGSCLPYSVTWWGLPRKCLRLGEAGLCRWGIPWRIWQLVAVRRKRQLTTHFTAR